ncbi:MAG: hypothetical protein ACU0B7_07745 [Paracoccaceae bacterium]|uniref:hypothetical protein n=1 Tax=Seohaeicola saemankumensis TaxID=481181 RepID=UPI001E49745F|nr:hypothetical protein [Seohaeicola saemankumensis]MCD1625704.1 hypothetical protein [Seohaeicola saemankumensis]
MLYQHITTTVCHFTADPLHVFIALSSDALFHASRLLAGSPGAKCVTRIVDALSKAEPLTRATKKDLQAMLDIFSLELVDDFYRPEAGYFAAIDPADPVVADICLLTDGLREALAESALLHATARPVAAAA